MDDYADALSALARSLDDSRLMKNMLRWSLEKQEGSLSRSDLQTLVECCSSSSDPEIRLLLLEFLFYEQEMEANELLPAYSEAFSRVDTKLRISDGRVIFLENLIHEGITAFQILDALASHLDRTELVQVVALIPDLVEASASLSEDFFLMVQKRSVEVQRAQFQLRAFVLLNQFACSQFEQFRPSVKYRSIGWAVDDWLRRALAELPALEECGIVTKVERVALDEFGLWLKEFLIVCENDSAAEFEERWVHAPDSRAARQKLAAVLFEAWGV